MNPQPSSSYGFILTRHVRCEKTNAYWNTCIKSLRQFYQANLYKIVVIDDNSNPAFLKAFQEYENVVYEQSAYPGAGELLAYYYFYRNHYFDKAVILHDSVFFQKKVHFHKLGAIHPVLPLWHFDEQKNDDVAGCLRHAVFLNHRETICDTLKHSGKMTQLFLTGLRWTGCFGLQALIDHQFLTQLQNKYQIFRLLRIVKTRPQRCNLERIFGILFALESPQLAQTPSLLGNIYAYMKWGTTYEEYILRKKNKEKNKDPIYAQKPLIKIWTGR
jgi:hypothetical protein